LILANESLCGGKGMGGSCCGHTHQAHAQAQDRVSMKALSRGAASAAMGVPGAHGSGKKILEVEAEFAGDGARRYVMRAAEC